MKNDILLETIERDCPWCEKIHAIEIRKRQSQARIKDEIVDFEEIYYLCLCPEPVGEEDEFTPAGIVDENLNRARNAYRRRHGLPESDSKHI